MRKARLEQVAIRAINNNLILGQKKAAIKKAAFNI